MPSCDRRCEGGSLISGQRGFVSFVVKPIFVALGGFAAAAAATTAAADSTAAAAAAAATAEATDDGVAEATAAADGGSGRMAPALANIESNLEFWRGLEQREQQEQQEQREQEEQAEDGNSVATPSSGVEVGGGGWG